MVRDGLLERVNVRERRQNIHQTGNGPGVHGVVPHYGLPSQSAVVRDYEGGKGVVNVSILFSRVMMSLNFGSIIKTKKEGHKSYSVIAFCII